ncbi:MAG TPA: zinc-ribbon domain-containing protein, partial [Ramlibacter sp.]|nr:zinc-ribbon domain-containing protein [Ramlibacter sp.]
MFKVVPDQLRVSEGWVRCGHCGEVFDAAAHMQQPSAVAQAQAAGEPASVPQRAGMPEPPATAEPPQATAGAAPGPSAAISASAD